MSYRETPVYIDNLLAMRGLCALGVLLVHSLGASDLSFRFYLEHGWELGATSQALAASLMLTTGKNFVLFFFVHSGYLMGKIFFMDRYTLDRAGIWKFYRGRFLRIAPLLYVNLVVCMLLLPSAQPTLRQALGDFLFVNNYTGRGINGVTWSLSWEMQYYLIAPFVFMYFCIPSTKTLQRLLALTLVLAVLSALDIRKYPPIEYTAYFLLGFAINLALRHWDVRKFRGSTLLAVGGGFFVGNGLYYALFNAGLEPLANPVVGLAAAMTIFLLECPRVDEGARLPQDSYGTIRLLHLRFWTWVGILSYGIYLWHFPLLSWINGLAVDQARSLYELIGGVDPGWLRVLLFHAIQLPMILAATLLVSLVTFLTIEIRFRPGLYSWDSSRYLGRYLKTWFDRRVAPATSKA